MIPRAFSPVWVLPIRFQGVGEIVRGQRVVGESASLPD